ncbi:hypothetical protein KFE25_007329 [Diacronema lutheri]|uniref:Uncharacterized protein n=1 Tax=Diacronema lutheri TaxID=2081491 RepID=A0A8J5XTT4_DIALT|nr:hypothetical protein KFE25_007329 [Diacronema lutheri]
MSCIVPNMRTATCGDRIMDDSLAGDGSGDHYFQFTAPSSGGSLTADTCLSHFDTKLAIFDTPFCPGSSETQLAFSDDDNGTLCGSYSDPSSLNSVIYDFPMVPSKTYMIKVEGFGSSDGEYDLELNCA